MIAHAYPTIANCWASLVIEECIRNNVTQFFIAPGSRSTALTMAVASHPQAKSWVHVDERALGFMALGAAKASQSPVAIITTSGTAVANLMPACCEAYADNIPIILLTADRAPEAHQTGANQTMSQTHFFREVVGWDGLMTVPTTEISPEYVISTIDHVIHKACHHQLPVHLNCQFRKPFTPVGSDQNFEDYLMPINEWQLSEKPYTQFSTPAATNLNPIQDNTDINTIIHPNSNGVITVSGYQTQDEINHIIQTATHLNCAILTDATSPCQFISHSRILQNIQLALSATIQTTKTTKTTANPSLDWVIQIGKPILSESFQAFCKPHHPTYIQINPTSFKQDPTHAVGLCLNIDIASGCNAIQHDTNKRSESTGVSIFEQNSQVLTQLQTLENDLIKDEVPLSDISIANIFTQTLGSIGTGNTTPITCMISNSLPIRTMSLFGKPMTPITPYVNRGVSGIDGIIATTVGIALSKSKSTSQSNLFPIWCVIGDLACLHDLNSLALLDKELLPIKLLLINNNGGKIFKELPIANHPQFETYMDTPHGLNFQHIAAQFKLSYTLAENAGQLRAAIEKTQLYPGPELIECQVDPKILESHKEHLNTATQTTVSFLS